MNSTDHPRGYVLQAYFDAELSDTDAAVVDEHCRDCARCREILADLNAVQQRLASDKMDVSPKPIWPHVAPGLQRERKHRIGFVFALGTTAACAAGLVLGLLLGTPANNNQSEENGDSRNSLGYLWSGGGNSSLLDIYSDAYSRERSGGS